MEMRRDETMEGIVMKSGNKDIFFAIGMNCREGIVKP